MTELNNSINQDIDADDLSKAAGGVDKIQKASITYAASAAVTGGVSVVGTAAIVSGATALATASGAATALVSSCAASAAV